MPRVQQVLKAQQVLLEPKVLRELRALPVPKEILVIQEPQVHKA